MTFDFLTLVEIAILALINYAFIRHLQATRGGGLLAGFIIFVIIAVTAFAVLKQLDLPRLSWLADLILPAVGIGLLIIFQPELRYALTRIGNLRLVRGLERLFSDRTVEQAERAKEAIVTACRRMAKRKVGALIVVQRRGGIEGFAQGGTRLGAELSATLIETIFYVGTPLHDGAAFVMDGRLMYAGCHLPLSESSQLSPELGMRHRAALGLAEQSDALVIVISEETGRMSYAHEGVLHRDVSITELEKIVLESLEWQIQSAEGAPEATTAEIPIEAPAAESHSEVRPAEGRPRAQIRAPRGLPK